MVTCLNDDPTWCLVDSMVHSPIVGSNSNNTWFGRAGCGALVCPEGTYDEANAAIVEHRDAVRQNSES